jgi:hypothetical protein
MMIAMTRLTLVLLLLLCALAVLGGARPQWLASLGWDGLGLSDLRTIVDAQRRQAEIIHNREIVTRRLWGKVEVARDVVAGRTTLFEAAAAFRKLEEMTAEYIIYPRKLYPGETEEERLCHQVISWAGNEAYTTSPCQGEALAQRLEEELREHIWRHGTVRLPAE